MSIREYQTPANPKSEAKSSIGNRFDQCSDSLLSPRFRSAAAMAGWDEETLLVATLVVEDTPERESKHKKRPCPQISRNSSTNSKLKRATQQQNPAIPDRDLIFVGDEAECVAGKGGTEKEHVREKSKGGDDGRMDSEPSGEVVKKGNNASSNGEGEDSKRKGRNDGTASSPSSELPCLDRLREELSCAICLEICFEPSTTACGHSFCKKCLKSAADKCGKRCPKCRQLISNARACSVNTVLWNTIQLLFPKEVEARRRRVAVDAGGGSTRRSVIRRCGTENSGEDAGVERGRRRRSGAPSQAEDAALAFRLQREEFMQAFGGRSNGDGLVETLRATQQWHQSMHRVNFRAIASRAVNIRLRGRHL